MKKLILMFAVFITGCGVNKETEPIYTTKYTVWSTEYSGGNFRYFVTATFYDGSQFHSIKVFTDSNYVVGSSIIIK